MKKRNEKKLSLSSETVRDLRSVDADGLRRVAGGDSITGSCQQDGCNNHSGTHSIIKHM
jgi:hypothetical protein